MVRTPTAHIRMPAFNPQASTYAAWIVGCLCWAVEGAPLGGSPLFPGRGAVHRQASWAHTCGVGGLAAGSHEGEGVIQKGVHGLACLLDGRLRGDVLGGREGQPRVPPQLSRGRCLHIRREVGIGLQQEK